VRLGDGADAVIDFAAWVQTYVANVLIGRQHGWAWLLLSSGCLTWAYIGWRARYKGRRIWWMVAGNVLTAATAAWNWIQWR